jgi:hypothetical protein
MQFLSNQVSGGSEFLGTSWHEKLGNVVVGPK